MDHSLKKNAPAEQKSPLPESLPAALGIIVETGKIPNALLLTGTDTTCKTMGALALAKALNCLEREESAKAIACNQCRSCMKINNHMHPDIIKISPEKGRLKIDQIRDMLHIIASKPHEGRIRVILINDADTMNAEAANALLKKLEEPPERTLFILLAPDMNRLLPTIISRCRHVRISPLAPSSLIDALHHDNVELSYESIVIAVRTASGDRNKAIMLLDDDWIQRRHFLLTTFYKLMQPDTPRHTAVKRAMLLAEKLANETDRLSDLFMMVKCWFRDLTLISVQKPTHGHTIHCLDSNQTSESSVDRTFQSNGSDVINRDFLSSLAYLCRNLPSHFFLSTLENVHNIERQLQSHASARSILERFFLSILPSVDHQSDKTDAFHCRSMS